MNSDKKLTIVIPTFVASSHKSQLLHNLLYGIFRCDLSPIYGIVVVDDSSHKKFKTGGLVCWWKDLFETKIPGFDFQYVRNEKNLGFLKSSNLGISKSKTSGIILVSDDVSIISSDAFVETRNAVYESQVPSLVGKRALKFDTGWNVFSGKIFTYLEGWYLAWDVKDSGISGFDERFSPNDYEDVDLSTQFVQAGMNLKIIESEIAHIGGATISYSEERKKITLANREKFADKWKALINGTEN